MQKFLMSRPLKQFSVLGIPVHILENYLSWLTSRIKENQGCHIVTLNAEMTMEAENNSALATVINQADLVIPDGAGIVLYLRFRGEKVERCPGIELAESLLKEAGKTENSWSVFLYGGMPGIAETAAKSWQQTIPGLNIVGTENGYISATDLEKLKQNLQNLQPRLILVGLGVPRQEFWIAENRHLCPNSTWMGIGGSMDIWAGNKLRAPAWFRDNHLEWLYRLYQEPWRWRRMLMLPKFAWRTLIYSLTH